jgi:hypothetical protein
MIEVTNEWLEQKRREAKGELSLSKDVLLDALQSAGLPEFNKLPPRWRTLVGYHITAKEKARRLKAEASEVVPT